jgi:hypothetical protein
MSGLPEADLGVTQEVSSKAARTAGNRFFIFEKFYVNTKGLPVKNAATSIK